MNWLHYLLEANIYLAAFYTGYCLFLTKETYYTLNRVYLLLSCLISFLLPMTQLGILKPADHGKIGTVYIVPANVRPIANQIDSTSISLTNTLFYAYLVGVIVLASVLLFKLFKLIQLIRKVNKIVEDKYKIVPLEDSNIAFSFFNYLFIGSKTEGSDVIIRHEMVHIRQKHTIDILFLEFIKIINWFNPFVYLLQNSLKTIHEYIADEQTAAADNDTLAYSSFLLNNAYGLNGSSVTHSFFNYNLLKKRIIMLNQKRSGNLARLKYLIAVPICAAALCASTLSFSKTYAMIDLAPRRITTPGFNKTHASVELVPARIATDLSSKEKKQHFLTPPPALPHASAVKPSKMGAVAKLMPVPLPPQNPFDSLIKYIQRNIHYPKNSKINHITGRVFVAFNIIDGKIDNMKIVRGLDPDIDAEAIRVVKNFNGPLNAKPSNYVLPLCFAIQDANGNWVENSPDIKNKEATKKDTEAAPNRPVTNTTSYILDEIVIVSYE